ncbi:hypothetical protein BDZ88DRAFT_422671 [Geranomyces variabilis]|nr:hypothetical protein BDZ88DRAFT_422671 [Geranomyces variabilis]
MLKGLVRTAATPEVAPSTGVAAASASDAAANLGVDASNEHEGATIADSDMQGGLVCGVFLSRSDSDELKRSIYSSLMDSIEPRPVNFLNVFLHEVDPPRNQQPPAPRPNKGDLSDEVNKYIDNFRPRNPSGRLRPAALLPRNPLRAKWRRGRYAAHTDQQDGRNYLETKEKDTLGRARLGAYLELLHTSDASVHLSVPLFSPHATCS